MQGITWSPGRIQKKSWTQFLENPERILRHMPPENHREIPKDIPR